MPAKPTTAANQSNIELNLSLETSMEPVTNKPAESAAVAAPTTATQTTTGTTAPGPPSADMDMIAALRLPQNFGAALSVKKLLTTVPVGKPLKTQFFRCHPDPVMVLPVLLLETEQNESYAVSPSMAHTLGGLARAVHLYVVIDRQGNLRLVPVPMPNESGVRNPWHESLVQALETAKTKWVRISSNRTLGAYDANVALGALSDPEWPTTTVEELASIAFRNTFIKSPDHAVVQTLLGQI
jgi:hypothetical protein